MTPERWRQIEDLYHAARKLVPEERAVLLAQADPDIRRDVAAMLEQVSRGELLDRPAAELLTESTLTQWTPGVQFGPYRIEAPVGAGGMGEVYRALDRRLGRTVALKLVRPERAGDAGLRERFNREARAISSLNHPHVCTLYDVGEQDGVTYLVMEYVEGETLTKRLKQGPLPLDAVLRYGAETASALAAAHARGIIHRDLKPANLMVTSFGIKVLDFGLVKFTAAQTDPEPFRTRSHVVVGTPAYMSPEQSRGEPLDGRSDIFALGCVLYEAATGTVPFQGRSEVVTLAPPAPSSLRPELPRKLDAVLDRAMAKDRELRYASASDFEQALRTLRTSASPAAWSRMTRKKLAAAAVLAVLSAIGLRWYLIKPPVQVGPTHLAVLPFLNLGNDPANQVTSDGLLETLSSRLSNLDSSGTALWVVPASEVRRRKVTEPAEAVTQLGVNFVVTGSVQREKRGVRLTVNLVDPRHMRQIGSAVISEDDGNYPALEDLAVGKLATLLHVEPGRGSGQKEAHADPASYQEYLEAMGYLHRWDQQGNLEKAVALFEKAVQDDPHFHLGLAGLAEAYRFRYALDHNPKWVDLALAAANRALKADPGLEGVYVTLGRIHIATGHDEVAREEFERALALAPRDADAIQGMALTYEKLGRNQQAEAMFRLGAALLPDSWEGYFRLGNFYFSQRRFPAAEAQYRRVLELAPDNASAYTNLGAALKNESRYEEARAVLEKAVALNPTYSAYNNLANAYYFEGRYADSAAIYEKALQLNQNDYLLWGNLGAAYAAAPQLANKARPALEKAALLAEQKAREAPDASVRAALGEYYARLGMPEKARVWLESALAQAPQDSTILLNVAEGYAILGDRAAAALQLRRALQLGSSVKLAMRIPALKQIAQEQSVRDNN